MRNPFRRIREKNVLGTARDVTYPSEQLTGEALGSLRLLEDHVIFYATGMQRWYLRNKAKKRVISKIIRFIAIVCLVTGGLYPVIAHLDDANAYLGYVLLGAAAGLYILDRMFDISSSWMRDIASIQEIDSALYSYHLERTQIALDKDAEAPEQNERRVIAIETLAEKIFAAVKMETAEWRSTFEDAIVDLERLVKPEETISGASRNVDEGAKVVSSETYPRPDPSA